MGDYRRLISWQQAEELAVSIYGLTAAFPDSERRTLGDQMRRAAVSVGSNLAEGSGRQSANAFRAFARIALGSLSELSSQLSLAERLGFVSSEAAKPVQEQCVSVGRLLGGLLKTSKPGNNQRSNNHN